MAHTDQLAGPIGRTATLVVLAGALAAGCAIEQTVSEPITGRPAADGAEPRDDEVGGSIVTESESPPPSVAGEQSIDEVTVAADRVRLMPDGRTLLRGDGVGAMVGAGGRVEFGYAGPGSSACPRPCARTPVDASRWVPVLDDGVYTVVEPADGVLAAFASGGPRWRSDEPLLALGDDSGRQILGISPTGTVSVLAGSTGRELVRHEIEGFPAGLDAAAIVEAPGRPPLLLGRDGRRWATVRAAAGGTVVDSAGRFEEFGPVDLTEPVVRIGMLLPGDDVTYDLRTGGIVPGSDTTGPVIGVAGDARLVARPTGSAGLRGTDTIVAGPFAVRLGSVDRKLTIDDGLVRGIVAHPDLDEWFYAVTGRTLSLVELTERGLRIAWTERFTDTTLGELADIAVDRDRVVVLHAGGESVRLLTVLVGAPG